MDHESRELARIASGIGKRILRVCGNLSEMDFAALCMQMARVQMRGERRAVAEWGSIAWPGARNRELLTRALLAPAALPA